MVGVVVLKDSRIDVLINIGTLSFDGDLIVLVVTILSVCCSVYILFQEIKLMSVSYIHNKSTFPDFGRQEKILRQITLPTKLEKTFLICVFVGFLVLQLDQYDI